MAITAAMLNPTGLGRFAAAFPDRTFDVGIAEQHAVVSAAGLAAAGLHPVVALYATFVNRAFDQVLMDAGLHEKGVTFALDRAGITGTDGASHNGMWDISLLGLVPGLEIAAPRDQLRLVDALDRAVTVDDRPTVVRYSKERLPDVLPAVTQHGSGRDQVDILRLDQEPEVLVVGYGQFAGIGMEVAARLSRQGISTTVADPLWCVPVSPELVALARGHRLVVSIEDNLLQGGLGERLRGVLAAAADGAEVPVMAFGIQQEFLAHGSRDEVLSRLGLDAREIARQVLERALGLEASVGDDLVEQGAEELDLPGTGATTQQ